MAEGKQDLIASPQGLKAETVSNNGLDFLINKKILYHGSSTQGITSFTPAEEDTVGSGIYFTSEAKDAIGYARRRSRSRQNSVPILYETQIENLRLANLRNDESVKQLLEGFKEILKKELSNPDIKWHYQEALRRSIDAINQGKIGCGNLREATFAHTDKFTRYLESLGYDGLVTFEGGEGEDIGVHDTYLIFDPKKVKITKEHKIT